ncbi:aerobic respiration two-component sensor histidine kinase ArcB [Motilimonas eburnea]|uniref:aerobic respiration two-component sensor histidine kinase ArcB n=1 Tax=Motilimonas eburnea TaxID=1737488 RepID=UPI001E46B484|nr:aerobic respiration two-component sensor histidine kinase ArcB [Motilimonas eburnea]MCE2570954.1 aerobic respiration two-component sensor histidine kinase ArcB [Motilimonas eburnea]
MKKMKLWSQFYVSYLTRLGIFKFSFLMATCLILLALFVQIAVTLFLSGEVKQIDLVRSVFFGLLIAPWAIYFFSAVVDQLELARKKSSLMVKKLQDMRERDLERTQELTATIEQMHQEFEQRQKAERARSAAMTELENEIKQREEAQQTLEDKTALLRSFIDSSPDLVYYRNEKGCFSGCNKAMESLTGRKESELIGLTPRDVYRSDIAEKVIETDAAVFDSNEPLTYEQWLEFPSGRKAYFELSKVPFFDQKGKRLGLLGFGRDITERKKYEEKLEKASRDKTTFISTISHELRTPLNGIVGLSRMLLDSELNKQQQKYLKTIHVSATTLGNIFNDIIDLDKLDRKRLEIAPQPLNFHDFVSDLESLAHIQAQQKNLYLSSQNLTPLPDFIEADGTRLRQVMWNLITNAVKFTDQGRVDIRVSAHPLDEDKTKLVMAVQDTGMGIPEDQLKKIFSMYYQVKGTKQATGSGIGLAVSSKLINAMGGEIKVDSQLGKGSTFTVELIVDVPKQINALSERVKALPKLDILLVEDVELNVTVAKALLEKLGHSVAVAMTGQAALDRVAEHRYQLILLDIQLPDFSGFEVVAKLRDTYQEDLCPVVALTANVISDPSEYIERGMDDAISKPLSVEAVVNMVSELFAMEPLPAVVPREPKPAFSTEALLDIDMLTDFLSAVNKETLISSVELFEKLMPEYLSVLESNLIARDQAGIVSEAHKIKGAAGSVGLKRLRELAQKAQSPDLPAWWDNIDDWVEKLKREYPANVEHLYEWIEQQ